MHTRSRTTKPPPSTKVSRATTSKATTSSTTPRWRRARATDHDAIAAGCVALYAKDPGALPMTTAHAKRTLRLLAKEPARGVAVVAVDVDSAIVGYALLCSFLSNELHGEVCTLDELWVAPAHRSRGLTTALVQGLVARRWPWFRRAVALELEVSPRNRRARALYERLGFTAQKNASLRRLLS